MDFTISLFSKYTECVYHVGRVSDGGSFFIFGSCLKFDYESNQHLRKFWRFCVKKTTNWHAYVYRVARFPLNFLVTAKQSLFSP